jgi:hypothetical protein
MVRSYFFCGFCKRDGGDSSYGDDASKDCLWRRRIDGWSGLTVRRRIDGWRRWGYDEILKKDVEKKEERKKEKKKGAAVEWKKWKIRV